MLASYLMVCLSIWGAAHEGLDLQIARATREIEDHPGRADLHFFRAELHRVHEDWKAAQTDFDRAAALDPALAAVDLGRTRLWLAFGDAAEAKRCVDRFLARAPESGDGFLERARAVSRLGRPKESAEDYTRALARIGTPLPEIYLERAAAQRSSSPEEALRGIEEGLGKLGPVVSLRLAAIDLDLELRRFESALARLGEIEAGSERKDPWLVRRAEVLLAAGRRAEAREACGAALAAMDKLPAGRRSTPFTRELEHKVRGLLEVTDEKR